MHQKQAVVTPAAPPAAHAFSQGVRKLPNPAMLVEIDGLAVVE